MKKFFLIMFLVLTIIVSFFTAINGSDFINKRNKDDFKRCMNIGNALEAPKGIKWDVTMKKEYFDIIKKAGFDSVRLPVRFSDYAKASEGYKLDEKFMKQIDEYVKYALDDDLVLILDFHNFFQIMDNPEKYRPCLVSIWDQLARRYRDYPKSLMFELLNEPQNNLKGELWNQYIRECVEVIRKTDKNRKIIVGPDNYYSVSRLEALSIPKDKNIIVSFHYYEPNKFTFQGNKYHKGFEKLKDIKWTASREEIAYMKSKFDIAKKWSIKNKVPIFLGEFGANKNAPAGYRKLWTAAVKKQAEEHGFSWGYWELCSYFGVYDTKNSKWDNNMLRILIPKDK